MRTLILVGSIDGSIGEDERNLVQKIGKQSGLRETEVGELILEKQNVLEAFLPGDRDNQMRMLFDVMRVVYADGLVTSLEIAFVADLVHRLNLRPEIVHHLIDLFQYGSPSAEEWKDFVEYINEVFVR